MPDWKDPKTLERMLAAFVASNNQKVDNQAIARYMDESYDAIENRTRVYKREALKLVKEAEEAGRMTADMRKRKNGDPGSPRKARNTPKKSAVDLHGVTSGRVTKTPTKSPSKKNAVKHENFSSDSSVFDEVEVQNSTGNSFAFQGMNFDQPNFGGSVPQWNEDYA